MFIGIILCLLGVLVLFAPVAAGEAVVLIVAAVLVLTGIAQVVQGLRSGGWSASPVAIVFGAVIAVLGVMVWLNPAIGSGFLTVLLMLFFVANGLWKVSTAWRYRGARGWVWLLLSGLVSLVFVYLLWIQWPLSGAWAIGVLVGIDLLLTGLSMAALAYALRRVRGSRDVDTINL
ncbi:MAG: DUF308 domain-containing protein [Xanthomonadales bacterium]